MPIVSYNGTELQPGISMWVDTEHPAMRWYDKGTMPKGTRQAILSGRELPIEVDDE